MAELDELLRGSLTRLAETTTPPESDSAGVADAIRARVAAGDTGTPVAGSTAPGWGGVGLGALFGALAVVTAAGVVGAALGASGLLGRPVVEQVQAPDAVVDVAVDAHECVDGAVTGRIPADTRVLALARSDDGAWLGLRDPATLLGTVWVRAASVTADAPADLAELPIAGACPTFAVEPIDPIAPDPQPAPTDDPAPGPQPGPAPAPGDTTAPVMGQSWANPTIVYNGAPSTITALASDDVAVTSVSVSWSGAASGSASMTRVGGEWRFTWANGTDDYGLVTFTIRARDAAGNVSSPSIVVVDHQYFG